MHRATLIEGSKPAAWDYRGHVITDDTYGFYTVSSGGSCEGFATACEMIDERVKRAEDAKVRSDRAGADAANGS